MKDVLKKITEVIKIELFKDFTESLKNIQYITVRDFAKVTGIYVHTDFIAGYLYYNNNDYVLLDQYTFPSLNENRKNSILFHESMHALSTKKYNFTSDNNYDVGFVFKKINFVNINEGLNEIATQYIFEKAYEKEKYVLCKAYNIDRKICEYLIVNIYKDKREFLLDYINEKPYSFYKKLFYTFNINNLLEFKNALDCIYEEIRCGKNLEDSIKRNIRKKI